MNDKEIRKSVNLILFFRRGLNAQPLLPGFCGSWEVYNDIGENNSAASCRHNINMPFVGLFLLLVVLITNLLVM